MEYPKITILCCTEKRPQFATNIITQFQWMNWTGRKKLVVATSYNDIQTVKALVLQTQKCGIDSVMVITPEMRDKVNHQKVFAADVVIDMSEKSVETDKPGFVYSLGDRRNQAMQWAEGGYLTWMDDDDLQRKDRLWWVWKEGYKAWGGKLKSESILVRDRNYLIDLKTGLCQLPTYRTVTWYEGIYHSDVLAFPRANRQEDTYWMQQFFTAQNPKPHVIVGPPDDGLSLNIKHEENTSFVRHLNMSEDFWEAQAKREWMTGNSQWTGIDLLKKQLRDFQV